MWVLKTQNLMLICNQLRKVKKKYTKNVATIIKDENSNRSKNFFRKNYFATFGGTLACGWGGGGVPIPTTGENA